MLNALNVNVNVPLCWLKDTQANVFIYRSACVLNSEEDFRPMSAVSGQTQV